MEKSEILLSIQHVYIVDLYIKCKHTNFFFCLQYWGDLKHKAKSRAASRRQEASSTGGGPSTQPIISELDKKILSIIGESAVYGDIEHRVPVFVSSEVK